MQSLLGIPALVVIGSSVWVGADASQRDFSGDRFADRTWKWVVGCLLLWIVAFPIYLAFIASFVGFGTIRGLFELTQHLVLLHR